MYVYVHIHVTNMCYFSCPIQSNVLMAVTSVYDVKATFLGMYMYVYVCTFLSMAAFVWMRIKRIVNSKKPAKFGKIVKRRKLFTSCNATSDTYY